MFRNLICSMALGLAGCAGHEVRCDAHLQAINAPAPKPALDDALNADTADAAKRP